MRPVLVLALTSMLSLLAACDQLGIETPAVTAARKDTEGRAIGGACRHAGRAIEDCYTLNPKADKAAVFAGWREMNDYMRENKIEEVAPLLPPPKPAGKAAKPAAAEDGEAEAEEEEETPAKTASADH
ncbi:hypothetical protein [Caldimonas brevitalea]|uniref:Uncharacterized protein n=1 Tax=Caldimonas brevitalea TaxID=413882 RepID=A0A0G3BGY0_9BURK|nr:hypothetical protein [Caldimonas brevitalea]AKJ27248.1 hypothetical protein AAW51_0557 [Caldimonas brevitalea]